MAGTVKYIYLSEKALQKLTPKIKKAPLLSSKRGETLFSNN